MKKDVKLIATDLDGTFLRDDKTFDQERFRSLLKRLCDKGIVFVMASGRQKAIMEEQFAPFLDDLYLICENGGYIAQGRTPLRCLQMAKEDYLLITQLLSQGAFVPVLTALDHAYMLKKHQKYIDLVTPYYRGLILVDRFEDVDDVIIKVSTNHLRPDDLDEIEALRPLLSKKFRMMVSGYEWFDIQYDGFDKGRALSFLMDELGIDSSQAMAFGDAPNDLSMLKMVGYAYAMANSQQVVYDYASYQAPSNNEQGVLSVLEDIL